MRKLPLVCYNAGIKEEEEETTCTSGSTSSADGAEEFWREEIVHTGQWQNTFS